MKYPYNVIPPLPGTSIRRYLPSAFDDGMNIYETLLAMHEYLNQVIEEVNFLSKEWSELKEWIEKHLDQYTREELERMFEEGYFTDVLENMINPMLKEMNDRINNNNSHLRAEFKELVESLQGGGVTAVVKDEAELKAKYPNGAKGIVVTSNNGHYWFWDTTAKVWVDGGAMTGEALYNLVRPNDGKAIRLDTNEEWRANPDIVTLKTGYYSVMVKTEPGDPEDPGEGMEYVITKNFPPQITGRGTRCSVWVLELPENNRKDFIVKSNTTNRNFTSSLLPDGSLFPWAKDIKESELNQVQVWKTTYNSGQGFGFDYRTEVEEQKGTTQLVSRLMDLPTGVYYRGIPTPEELAELGIKEDLRGLPRDFRGGSSTQVIVNSHTEEQTKTIILMNRYFNKIWMGHVKESSDGDPKKLEMRWNSVGDTRKLFDKQRRDFATKVFLENDPDAFKFMLITDTHIEYDSSTAQYSAVNSQHMDNFDDVCQNITPYDFRVHMGDVCQGYGNYAKDKGDKWQAMSSLIHIVQKFYREPRSYAVYGNHDTNGGYAKYFSGLVSEHVSAYYTQEQLNRIFVKPLGLKTNKNYYTIDDDTRKIRKIFMNTYDYILTAKENGVVHRSPYGFPSVSADQVHWLVDQLYSTPEGYEIMLFAHNPLDNVFADYQFPNGDAVRKILQDYQNKRADDYIPTNIDETDPEWNWYNAQGKHDFTNRKGGNIIAMFSGHRHTDEIKIVDGIQYIGLLCSKAESGDKPEKPARTQWRENEDSFRHVTVNQKKKTIKLTTFGAGEDYLINYGDGTSTVLPKVIQLR